MPRFFFPAVFSLLFLCHSPTSLAGSTEALEAEVSELKQIHAAQAKNLATALNQLQEVLASFQNVNGRIDSAIHSSEEQDKLIRDNQRRLEILEDKITLMVTQMEELKAAGLIPQASAAKLGEFDAYSKGLSRLNAEQYKEATQTFRSFLAAHPQSDLAPNAQYWIGESFYAMRDFPAAVAEFQKVVQKFPKSVKIPACLLKQGFAFFEMQSFEDSKAFLAKLISRYPGTNEAIAAQEKILAISRLMEQRAREAVERKEAL